jgi:tetratricopeptide (TPR) repeat protein
LGHVSKHDFVAGIVKCELRAAQETRAFYVRTMLPWFEQKKLPTEPTLWFCDWWDSPQNALRGFTDKSAYPWRPYSRTHDWATVNRGWRLGKIRKTLGMLREMHKEKGYEDDEAEVCYWSGLCLERLNRPNDAVTALDESIRLDSSDPEAYQARARILQKLGKADQAKADLDKAKQLESQDNKNEQ